MRADRIPEVLGETLDGTVVGVLRNAGDSRSAIIGRNGRAADEGGDYGCKERRDVKRSELDKVLSSDSPWFEEVKDIGL